MEITGEWLATFQSNFIDPDTSCVKHFVLERDFQAEYYEIEALVHLFITERVALVNFDSLYVENVPKIFDEKLNEKLRTIGFTDIFINWMLEWMTKDVFGHFDGINIIFRGIEGFSQHLHSPPTNIPLSYSHERLTIEEVLRKLN